MGLILSDLHLLAIEQKKHPVKGDVLTIGQQAIYGTVKEVRDIFESHGLKLKDLKENFDIKNKIPSCVGNPRGEFTNGYAVFSLLGADKVYASDVSDYEGADYIIDLNYDVSKEYYEKFDFVLDSGTLEHVFNVPIALSNMARMVKKGGRIMFILPCSNTINHGFYSFNPNLFFDFFSANGFSDFSCYLIEESSFNVFRKSKIYQYNYISDIDEYSLYTKNMVEICFCATKRSDANLEKIKEPIQGMYISTNWGKNKGQKSISDKINKTNILEKIKRKIEWQTRKYRPEFVDILYKNNRRKKNLTYLGKF